MVVGIESQWLAFDFDMAVSYLGLVVQNRLDETKEELRGGKQVTVRKYRIEQALGIRPSAQLITTHEQAIAMGFINMDEKQAG